MFTPSPELVRDIGVAEADELTAYQDSEGLWTVGRGHLLEPQDHNWTGYTITPEQDQIFFAADIADAQAYASRLPEWPSLDTLCRQNAVTELIFNMHGRWLEFVLCRHAIMVRDWSTAKVQLLDSKWASEVHAARANRIADYLFTGEYP
jgi:GH24 family phage-related lysozyme (muramidase)